MNWINMLDWIKLEWARFDQYHSMVWMAIACLLVFCIFLGATQRIVFYKDKTDCFLSFGVWPLSFAIIYFSVIPNKDTGFAVIGTLFAVSLLRNVIDSWRFNPGYWFLAIPIGMAKFTLGFLYVLTWFEFLGGSKNRRRSETLQLLVIIGLLSGLISYLINGRKVFQRRLAEAGEIDIEDAADEDQEEEIDHFKGKRFVE